MRENRSAGNTSLREDPPEVWRSSTASTESYQQPTGALSLIVLILVLMALFAYMLQQLWQQATQLFQVPS